MIFRPFFKTLPQHATLRRLALMRAIALIGQLLIVAAAQLWMGISLPLVPIFAVMLLLAAFNGWTWWRMQQVRPAGDMLLSFQLFVDVAALSALLYFSGGATNPFVSFYLPALAVAAAILPWRFSLALALFSLACYSAMLFEYVPLHMADHDHAVSYHLSGMWANFILSAALITWFVARMSGAVRERDAQLALARERYLQSERIVALGTQAASTAHEMGTPLSTVAVIVGEMRADAGSNAALAGYRDDLATIEAQIALCKSALGRMDRRSGAEALTASEPVNLGDWLRNFIDGWRLRYPATRLEHALEAGAGRTADTSAIGQIVLTLLDNAAQAAADTGSPVHVSLRIERDSATIRVKDEGPGIAPALLERLGYEPVQSSCGGLGIGLMLAFSTARQIGATIELTPREPAGIVATLTVPLA